MLTLVWDRDDVLNDLMRCWLDAWHRPRHPACTLRYEDLRQNPPHRLLSMTLAEYRTSLDEFRLSPQAALLAPVPEVLDWFASRGHLYRHVVLTGTSLSSVPSAAEWTFRHFGRWVRSFHFVPAERTGENLPAYDVSKQDALRRLGAGDVMVEDSPENLAAAEAIGLRGLLIPRPWNGGAGTVAQAMEQLDRLLVSLS